MVTVLGFQEACINDIGKSMMLAIDSKIYSPRLSSTHFPLRLDLGEGV
ncbi:MAG TPA: hypothetical protein VGE85_15915 [Terracidiphilus sp.]